MATSLRTPATATMPVLDALGYDEYLGYGDPSTDAR